LTELLLGAATAASAEREGVVADWAFTAADGVDSRAWDLLGAIAGRGGVVFVISWWKCGLGFP